MKTKLFVTRKYYDRVTRELTNKVAEQKRRIDYLENLVNTNHEIGLVNKYRARDIYDIARDTLMAIEGIIDEALSDLEVEYNV